MIKARDEFEEAQEREPTDEELVRLEKEIEEEQDLDDRPEVLSAATLFKREIGKHNLLTREEEVELGLKKDAGDQEASDRLFHSNLRLVVSISRFFFNRGLTFMELVNEGCIGLLKAVDKFDAMRGNKFSTYATWWIKQAMQRALVDQGVTIRIPVHVSDLLSKVNRVAGRLTKDLGRNPTDEELAEAADLTVKKVRMLKTLRRKLQSLEAPIGEDEDLKFSDRVYDPNAVDPLIELYREQIRQLVSDPQSRLKPREALVLALRYGLEDDNNLTLEAIGHLEGVTRERIRQIQVKALGKLGRRLNVLRETERLRRNSRQTKAPELKLEIEEFHAPVTRDLVIAANADFAKHTRRTRRLPDPAVLDELDPEERLVLKALYRPGRPVSVEALAQLRGKRVDEIKGIAFRAWHNSRRIRQEIRDGVRSRSNEQHVRPSNGKRSLIELCTPDKLRLLSNVERQVVTLRLGIGQSSPRQIRTIAYMLRPQKSVVMVHRIYDLAVEKIKRWSEDEQITASDSGCDSKN